MRRVAALLLLLIPLAGCQTYDLEDKWSPLSKLVERPNLPTGGDPDAITKGSHVYVRDIDKLLQERPVGSVMFDALMLHEQEHARRQFKYMGLPGEFALAAWVTRYGTDHEFMWEEEQRGYYYSITHRRKHGKWSSANTLAQAHVLSHNYKTIGGKRMVSFNEAKDWIEKVLAGDWKPD